MDCQCVYNTVQTTPNTVHLESIPRKYMIYIICSRGHTKITPDDNFPFIHSKRQHSPATHKSELEVLRHWADKQEGKRRQRQKKHKKN